jgi:hypothetical protein
MASRYDEGAGAQFIVGRRLFAVTVPPAGCNSDITDSSAGSS